MAEETDSAGEAFDDSLRIALTVASQFGQSIALLREQLAGNREADAAQEARELTARFEAERGAMCASLAPFQQPEWWDQARPEDIAQAHETATAWRDLDDVAKGASDTIRHEVRERYGLDADSLGGDMATYDAVVRAERERAEAAAERVKAGEELTAAQLLFAQADRHEKEQQELSSGPYAEAMYGERTDDELARGRENVGEVPGYDPFAIPDDPYAIPERGSDTAQESGSQLYDSSERRREFADSLEGKGIPEKTIAARLLADGENAKHPSEAVSSTAGKAMKIRGRGATAVQQRVRGGLSR
jgi:colicin import membrane protein